MELPEEKRPPKNIWHNEYKINEWFDSVFNTDSKGQFLEFDYKEVD